jgi:hypothetical protein
MTKSEKQRLKQLLDGLDAALYFVGRFRQMIDEEYSSELREPTGLSDEPLEADAGRPRRYRGRSVDRKREIGTTPA